MAINSSIEDISYLVLKKDAPAGCLSGKTRFFIVPAEHRSRTWFEKLADQNSVGKPTLPLIASPSNATAKSLIMAQGMDLFLKNNGLFDLDKAQIFANCLMAHAYPESVCSNRFL